MNSICTNASDVLTCQMSLCILIRKRLNIVYSPAVMAACLRFSAPPLLSEIMWDLNILCTHQIRGCAFSQDYLSKSHWILFIFRVIKVTLFWRHIFSAQFFFLPSSLLWLFVFLDSYMWCEMIHVIYRLVSINKMNWTIWLFWWI